MKKISFVIICIFSFVFSLHADEICDEALAEGKEKYDAGNYLKAKEFFEFVRNECGTYYGNVTNWINKCDACPQSAGTLRSESEIRGTLRFLPQLEMRPSSNAPNPVESREAPPTSFP